MRQTCQDLLREFRKQTITMYGEKLEFAGVGNRDVYNITAPFPDKGRQIIAGRVEGRDTEHSVVMFFHEIEGTWLPLADAPVYKLQDPFVSFIHGELIIGGVEIYPHPSRQGALGWRTNFLRGSSIADLSQFAVGPDGMKDIRLVEMDDQRIGVFTRPQGEIGGRGEIGFISIDTLDKLTPKTINQATLLKQFVSTQWGGANEIHLLRSGLLGVLGHIACFDPQGNRHYYPMVFAFDPQTKESTPMSLIARRANFPPGDAKRPDLTDVIFSGSIRRLPNKKARLYVGVSDVEAHSILIDDPFIRYENRGGL